MKNRVVITTFFLMSLFFIAEIGPGFFCVREAHSESVREPILLSVREAVQTALERNLDLLAERRNTDARKAEIGIEKGQFDPGIRLEVSRGKTVRPSASAVDVAILAGAVAPIRTDQVTYTMGVEQKLVTGTRYGLNWIESRMGGPTTVFDPNYASELSFELTQPLLKGLGSAVNGTDIVLARNSYSMALEELEDEGIQLAALVEETYWDLVFQRMRLAVEKEKKSAAVGLLEATRAKVNEGILPPIEVLVAEAAVADREEDILIAGKLVRDTEDQLRLIMNEEGDALIQDVPVIPRDNPTRDVIGFDLNDPVMKVLKETLEIARQRRPDIRRARLEQESREQIVRRAADAVLPALDFKGRTGLSGLGESLRDDLDRLGSGEFYTWQVGLVFSMPIGNRTAKSTLGREKMDARRVKLAVIKLEQELVIEIKEAVRRVRTNFRRIGITQKARELAEKKLETQTERFRLGLTTTQQVLEFQKDLAEAKSRELRAVTDLNKSNVNLARAKGTLLEERGITIK